MKRSEEKIFTPPPYLLSKQEVAEIFHTSLTRGLSEREVTAQRAQAGWNEVRTHEIGLLRTIFQRIVNPLSIMLLTAVGISLYFGETSDALIIALAVLFDVTFGTIYESYSKYKIELLKKQVPRITMVIRSGNIFEIPVRDVVPGDLCVISQGFRVPADIRLTRIHGLRVDESVMTGEAGDVEKISSPLAAEATMGDQRNMVFSGTLVTTGSAQGIVVATGEKSVLGVLVRHVIAAGVQSTPLEKKLHTLGFLLGVGILLCAVFLFLGGLLRGETAEQMFRQALTLVVSAIPEDLTLILTLTLAIGARRLLTNGGVVRHLTAAETLGDATIVCVDKTGTLTTGEITLVGVEGIADVWGRPVHGTTEKLLPRSSSAPTRQLIHDALESALAGIETLHLGNTASVNRGSSIERALLQAGEVWHVDPLALKRDHPLFDTLAFDPVNRFRASLHGSPLHPEPILFAVGAPDVLITKSVAASEGTSSVHLTPTIRQRLLDRASQCAGEGKHVLAVARRPRARTIRSVTLEDVEHLTFIALLVFEDPLRADARISVQQLQEAGVRLLLLTGDHRGTAEAVARDVGMLRPTGTVLEGVAIAAMSDELLLDALQETSVIARVDPFQKERIVRLLQGAGEIVGMVGDGVNDAAALRRADLGVAVGSATDVAKDASDLILVEQGISTLTAAVQEGRRVRETVRTVLAFLFSTNITEVFALLGALLLGMPLPFLPAMLLWINIVTDGTADIALALEPGSTRSGDLLPGRRRGIFRRRDPFMMLATSVAILLPTMLLYAFVLHTTFGELATARTVAFLTLATSQLLVAFSYRSLDHALWRLNPFSNLWLVGAVVTSFLLLVAAVEIPYLRGLLGTVRLEAANWFLVLSTALVAAVGVELRKPLFHWLFPSDADARKTLSVGHRRAHASPRPS